MPGRAGVNALLKSTGAVRTRHRVQDRMLGLLAGGPRLDDSDSRAELVQQEQRIFEAQKLLPLDLLFELADNLAGGHEGRETERPAVRASGGARGRYSAAAQRR